MVNTLYFLPPLFIHTNKQNELFNLVRENLKESESVGGYGCIIDKKLLKKEPEKAINFHLVRNRNPNIANERIEGHGEDGGIFHYQAIKSGQEFHGCILGTEEDLNRFKSSFINESITKIQLGRSINTQYGAGHITFGEIQENAVSLGNSLLGEKQKSELDENQLLLYFVSPVILCNDYGYTAADTKQLTTILEQRLGVGEGSIEVIKSFAREMVSGSFIAHWKIPEPVIRAWASGSSFLLQFKVDITEVLEQQINALTQDGLGEKRHLGFGQVRFVRSSPEVTDYYFSDQKKEYEKPGEISFQTKQIVERIYADYWERIILATATKRASDYYDSNYNKSLSSHLLGRLERIVQNSCCTDDLTDKIQQLRDKAMNPLKEMKLNDASLFEEMTKMNLGNWCRVAVQSEWELANKFKNEFGLEENDITLYKKYWQAFFRTLRKHYKAVNIKKEGGDANAVSE